MKKLRKTQANKLDEFIEDHLLPHKEFRRQVNEAIDIICTFLKETCFQEAAYPFRVSKVVKGGSSGKGTTLKDLSDADLVVFLTNLTSFQENFKHRARFIKEIRRQLEACQREKTFEVEFEVQKRRKRKLRALSFVLRSPGFCQGVKFDVLPAFDALAKYSQSQGPRKQEVDGSGLKDSAWAVEDPGRTVPPPLLRPDQVTEDYKPDPQIYVQLIQECENLGKEGEFSPCFTELQRDFLKNRPAKLKSLIRLVKHWYQLCKKRHGKKLPSQYALELLTIYAWEQEGSKTKFKTAEGFRTVLELVLKHQDLCVYWKKYYDFENPIIRQCLKRQLEKPRPVILDPADPTGNVAGREPQRWQLLAQEVTVWLRYSCCKNRNGSPVSTWNVPVTPPHYLCDLILLMAC